MPAKVRKELIATAKAILQGYEKGFSKCAAEDNCEFCGKL